VSRLDRGLPLTNVRAMDDRISESLLKRRFIMLLIGGFAALALVLALGGLYGVVSYATSQRRQELGLRTALGATAVDSIRLVMSDGLRVAFIGIGIGLPLAGILTRFMSAQLFHVRTLDPLIYAAASVLLVIVAGLACAVPALRASLGDPVTALRCE
jgi:putative ABC transport system permease protein